MQARRVERLAQEGEEAGVAGGSGLLGARQARHQDRRQRAQGHQLLEQLQAGHARQVEVHQREVEAALAGELQGFGGGGGGADLPTLAGEELHEAAPQGVVVLDQQHTEAL